MKIRSPASEDSTPREVVCSKFIGLLGGATCAAYFGTVANTSGWFSSFCLQVPRVKEGSQSVELAPHCVVKEVKSKIASWKVNLIELTLHCGFWLLNWSLSRTAWINAIYLEKNLLSTCTCSANLMRKTLTPSALAIIGDATPASSQCLAFLFFLIYRIRAFSLNAINLCFAYFLQ